MLSHFTQILTGFRQDKWAVTAIEYALLAALVAVVIISAVSQLGTQISSVFNNVSSEL